MVFEVARSSLLCSKSRETARTARHLIDTPHIHSSGSARCTPGGCYQGVWRRRGLECCAPATHAYLPAPRLALPPPLTLPRCA